MKLLHQIIKKYALIIPLLFFFFIISSYAQAEQYKVSSRYYLLESASDHQISENDLKLLDSRINYYNDFLRLINPVQNDRSRLILRMFSGSDEIDVYLEEKGLEKKGKNIFMLITDMEKAEIIFTPELFDTDEFYRYCFMQYLKSSIANPPPWISNGFLHFFDFYFDVDSDKNFIPELRSYISDVSDSDFSEAVKKIFYTADNDNMDNISLKISWAVIDYIHSGSAPDRYKRFLWDSLQVLDRHASSDKNINLISENVLKWLDPDVLAENLRKYILNTVTLDDLFKKGIELYKNRDFEAGAELFKTAAFYDSRALYYAGLCLYSAGRYSEASAWFINALDTGFEPGAVIYSLGLNSYAAGNFDEAREYFKLVIENYPGLYSDLSEEMAGKIK